MEVDILCVTAAVISFVLMVGGAIGGMIWADRQFKNRLRKDEETRQQEEAERAAVVAKFEEAAEAIHQLALEQQRRAELQVSTQ